MRIRPLFGAKLVGSAELKSNSGSPARVSVYRLDGSTGDIDFLKNGLDAFHHNPDAMVGTLDHVDQENHHELAEEAFEKSLALLTAFKKGKIHQPPMILAALDEHNRLLGLCLGHIERPLVDGRKIYTPLSQDLEKDAAHGQEPNHSSINWLVRFAPPGLSGIGKLLTAVQENLLPPSVKRVDVLSETSDYTPQAPRLYQSFGFRPIEELVPRFADPEIHGIPMSVSRDVYQKKSENILEQLHFVADKAQPSANLTSMVHFET